MSQQSEKYFTGWCGVYDVQERRITYAGGGHPPVFLMTGDTADEAELKMLESTGPMIGAIDELEFECESIDVGHYSRLFLYSDGVYEIHLPGGGTWTFDEFKTFMGQQKAEEPAMDRLRQHTLTLSGQDRWDDDFSIIEIRF
jgi:sigma-B regulation protein RsbU (phosphoserine phosphatase)